MKNLTTFTDQQLVQSFISGETNALEVLITRHKDRIFTSIFLMVKDKYLAEDIFQDLFIKIINTLKSGNYKEENKFLYWAMRIAHNMCVDHFRKVKVTPVVRTREGEDIFKGVQLMEDSMEEEIIKSQSRSQIMKLVDLLPEEQREVIILRHFADLKFKEIADLIKCSVNTVLGRMRYALINLRKMIEEKQLAM